jgi:tRNA-Thr(GGU) m(6)t(6)A37 methyltransferase TsaA
MIPIGYVESPILEEQDENWGDVESIIHLDPSFGSGLQGLEEFSNVIVIFYMHKASFHSEKDLIRRPRGRMDMPELGIFAQRAKHRPNPIGITTVKIIKIDENTLTVQGLDAINGTPILDLKPFVLQFDYPSDSFHPEWIDRLMEGYF